MISEMILSSEGLPTDVTSVWPFVCVCSLMDQQVVGLGEVTVTEPTDVLLFRPIKDTKYLISVINTTTLVR